MTQWGLDTLFNPAKRHMDEEKRRLQSTREEIGDSSGGKRIDLESGKVTIKKAEPAGQSDEDGEPELPPAETEPAVAQKKPAQKKPAQKKPAQQKPAQQKPAEKKSAPSPAAVRAAERRRRQAH